MFPPDSTQLPNQGKGRGKGKGKGKRPKDPCDPRLNGPSDKNPSVAIGFEGTGTTVVEARKFSYSGSTTHSECLKLPLKSGRSLAISWTRLTGQGATESTFKNDLWKPAGASCFFSFLPITNNYAVSTGVRRYSDRGNLGYSNSAVPDVEMPFSAIRGATYFTEYDHRERTYYEYWSGTGLVSDKIFGRLNRRYDAAGNTLLYHYSNNPSGSPLLRRITGDFSGGIVPYFEYADETLPACITKVHILNLAEPAASRTVYFEYQTYTVDGQTNPYLKKIVNPSGCTRLYDPYVSEVGVSRFHQIKREVDAEGYETYFEYSYGSFGEYLSKVVAPEGLITYYNYDFPTYSDTLKVPIGRNGAWTKTSYASGNSFAMLTCDQDALGNKTYYEYDDSGDLNRVVREMDPIGKLTYYEYLGSGGADDYALTVQVSAFNGARTYFGYDRGSYNLTKKVSPRHTATFPVVAYYTYDAFQNRTSVIDPLGKVTRFGRNPSGRIARAQDALGNTAYFNYSPTTGLLDTQVDGGGNVAYFGYSAFGEMVRAVSSRWAEQSFSTFTTYYEYDQLGRRIKAVDPLRGVTYFDWTGRGDLLDVIDAVGTRTAFVYNGQRVMTQQTVTDSAGAQLTQEKHGYDIYMNRLRTLDARGNTTYFVYDQVDRLSSRKDALSNTTSFSYDPAGSLAAFTDARGSTTYYFYDQLSRRTAQRDALDNPTYYFYDVANNQTYIVDARQNAIYFFYDALDRGQAIRDTLGNASYFYYDAAGNQSVAMNARFAATYFGYDAVNRLSQVQDALGNTTYFAYDAAGNRTRMTDARSNATMSGFDTLNRKSVVRDALSNATYYFYDAVGNLVRQIDARQNTAYFFYDGLRRTIASRDALANPSYFFYDLAGNRTVLLNARFAPTYFGYDVLNRRSKLQDAIGNTTYFESDAVGNQTKFVDARSNVTESFYDALNRPTVTRDALSNPSYYFYDEMGNRTVTLNARFVATYFGYDALSRRSRTQDALGNSAYYFYNAVGDTEGIRNPLLHATYFGFDTLNRLVRTQDAVGSTTYYEFDAVSNRTRVLDPKNHATLTRYDALNRPNSVRYADAGSVYYFYDETSNRTNVVDPKGNATYYGYDALNRAARIKDVLGKSLYFEYDAVGNLSRFVDSEGASSAHTYDLLNRRTLTNYVVAGSVTAQSLSPAPYYAYDEVGNLTRTGDAWGLQLRGYDAANRLLRHRYPEGSVVYYEYDPVSNPITRVYPGSAGRWGAAYDQINRQTKVQSPSGATAYFTYDAASNLTQKVLGNGMKLDVTYDECERVRTWRWSTPAGAPLSYFDYTRDAKGLITKAVREAVHTVYYRYDPCDRLDAEIWATTGASPKEVYAYRYQYDPAGNRSVLRSPNGFMYYFYDSAHRLTHRGFNPEVVSPTYYTYDENGSVTRITGNDGTDRFAYNAAGLIARIEWQGNLVTYFLYDGQLNRVGMTRAGTPTYFLWDGPNLLQERKANGSVQQEHTNADPAMPGIGQMLETYRPGDPQPKIYPVTDPRGSVTKWMAADGITVVDSSEYEAFGEPIPNSRALFSWSGQRFGYQGQTWMSIDRDVDWRGAHFLYGTPTRLYDPHIGRFLQNEPTLGGRPTNHYLYCAQNPLSTVDPSGRIDQALLQEAQRSLAEKSGRWDILNDNFGGPNQDKGLTNVARIDYSLPGSVSLAESTTVNFGITAKETWVLPKEGGDNPRVYIGHHELSLNAEASSGNTRALLSVTGGDTGVHPENEFLNAFHQIFTKDSAKQDWRNQALETQTFGVGLTVAVDTPLASQLTLTDTLGFNYESLWGGSFDLSTTLKYKPSDYVALEATAAASVTAVGSRYLDVAPWQASIGAKLDLYGLDFGIQYGTPPLRGYKPDLRLEFGIQPMKLIESVGMLVDDIDDLLKWLFGSECP